MDLKIHKTANEIEDVCISYGLCKILEDNDIEYNLIDEESMYIIYTNDFEIQELEWYYIELDDCNFINTSMNKNEKENNLKILNNFMEENIFNIFKYYSGNNNEIYSFTKSTPAIGIGSAYYTRSVKITTSPSSENTKIINRHLSFIGWIFSCGYFITKDKIETTALLIPNNTNQLIRPYLFTYKDKETGEVKYWTSLKNETSIIARGKMFLNTLKANTRLSKQYKSVVLITHTETGNKPMVNKTTYVNVVNLSNDLIDELLNKISWSNYSDDVKTYTSMYILDTKHYNNFSKMIRVLSGNKTTINKKFEKEMLNMYSERIKEIYNNESLQKLGKGLNYLMWKDKGYDIQAKLYSVSNSRHLLNSIRSILDTYIRVKGTKLLNNEELESLINSIQNDKECSVYADVLLTTSKVFIKYKNNDEEVEGDNDNE